MSPLVAAHTTPSTNEPCHAAKFGTGENGEFRAPHWAEATRCPPPKANSGRAVGVPGFSRRPARMPAAAKRAAKNSPRERYSANEVRFHGMELSDQ